MTPRHQGHRAIEEGGGGGKDGTPVRITIRAVKGGAPAGLTTRAHACASSGPRKTAELRHFNHSVARGEKAARWRRACTKILA